MANASLGPRTPLLSKSPGSELVSHSEAESWLIFYGDVHVGNIRKVEGFWPSGNGDAASIPDRNQANIVAGGVPEIVDHNQSGYLVAPKSADAIADAVMALIKDPSLQMRFSEAGRAKIVEKFNSDISAVELKKLLENMDDAADLIRSSRRRNRFSTKCHDRNPRPSNFRVWR
jgi:hypothetical protein